MLQLDRHLVTHVPWTVDDVAHQSAADASGSSKFPCSYEGCTSAFTRAANLRRHVEVAHEGVLHRCDFPGCLRVFRYDSALSRHKKSHTDQTLVHLKFENLQ